MAEGRVKEHSNLKTPEDRETHLKKIYHITDEDCREAKDNILRLHQIYLKSTRKKEKED